MVGEVEDEDLIQREDMVVTVSHKGYIKRVPLSTYRAQRRGGKGRAGMATRDEDFVTRIFIANTHTPVLFFSSRGMVYKMKVWRLPLAAPQARGKALVNLLPLGKDETITTILPLPEDETSWGKLDVMFATNCGSVRRNKLSDFIEVRQNGKIAMKLDEGDRIIGVQVCNEQHDVLLTSRDGQAIRFPVDGCARVQGPRVDRRARHQARQGRRGDLHGHPHPCRGGGRPSARPMCVRPISSAGAAPTSSRISSRRPMARKPSCSRPERYAELGAQRNSC